MNNEHDVHVLKQFGLALPITQKALTKTYFVRSFIFVNDILSAFYLTLEYVLKIDFFFPSHLVLYGLPYVVCTIHKKKLWFCFTILLITHAVFPRKILLDFPRKMRKRETAKFDNIICLNKQTD